MDSLTKSLLPIKYDKTKQWGVILIDPPTVRQALILHGLLPYWEDKSYETRIRAIISEWLHGSSILDKIQEVSWKNQVVLFRNMLASCEPDRDEKELSDSEQSWSRDSSISMLISEYRHWFKSDVLNEPWPFFLNQVKNLDQLKGESGLYNLSWYVAGKSQDGLNNLMDRAGYVRKIIEPTEKELKDRQQQADNAAAIAMLAQAHSKRFQA